MGKPVIIIEFEPDGTVTWNSTGWGNLPILMQAAQAAIRLGENPAQVIELLQAAGFEVVEIFEPAPGVTH